MRPLAVAVAASMALHAAAASLLRVGEAASVRAGPKTALTVSLKAHTGGRTRSAVPNGASARQGGVALELPAPAHYYTAREVDLKATPLHMKTRPRTSDSFPLGRIATAKVRLFINEEGVIDSLEVLEAQRLPDPALLQDFREVRFRAAERHGRPVKSQKIVEISFVP